MYSRSERKFLTPGNDNNPLLGPGCYLNNEEVLVAGKTVGNSGYAPFLSLTPRVSFFEKQVNHGPPPGNYDYSFGVELTHKMEGSALFGRSKTIRFRSAKTVVPAPDAYVIPTTANRKSDQKLKNIIKKNNAIGLNQQPIAREYTPAFLKEISALKDYSELEAEVIPDDDAKIVQTLGKTISLVNKGNNSHTPTIKVSKPIKDTTISWQRKYIPPSIPKGNNVYGYQENTDGDLEPRKPPKLLKEDAPKHLFSFVEKAKHENKGNSFARGRNRLSFRIYDNPGPSAYEYQQGEKYLQSKTKCMNPALMTLAPCKRITDEIIQSSVKKGIPGPGAYEVKDPIADNLEKPKNRIRLGGKGNSTTYINSELMKIPGPGAYFPEATPEKPHSRKPKPFGSSSKRFQDQYHYQKEPAVGSYDIDAINGIYNKTRKRNTVFVGQPMAAFGSISERFRPPKEPGPAAYDKDNLEDKNPKRKSRRSAGRRQALESRIQKLALRGPGVVILGQNEFESSNFHVPVFGSQASRFEERVPDLPPPGAYDVSEAFEHIKDTGRANVVGVLASRSKREIFNVTQHTPAPDQYIPIAQDKKPAVITKAGFLSTGKRFDQKYEAIPGPGSYSREQETSLLKKTHNVTFQSDIQPGKGVSV
ncbi:Sperm-tail PG-rich repeat-containing protein 2 [Globomyces sp. JEL0801]|nr:Sperm-tail PG-rich repeat-containing protein 2 [Globomyces sp. JEL0801]